MTVLSFTKPADFKAAATPLLLEREAENNLLFGLLDRIDDYGGKSVLRVVRDGNHPVAAALMTDPKHHLILSHATDGAIDALVESLAEDGVSLPGVQGSSPWAQRFAERWAKTHRLAFRPGVALGVYSLTRVISPPILPPGAMHVAMLGDVFVVARFMDGFREAIGEPDRENLDEVARQRIEGGSIHLWKLDGEAVSVANATGPTPNGIRLGLVYTPAAHRKHGYASALVAVLSQKLLDSGRRFCFLFTDLENATSNKIYRDVGYEFVCEQHQFLFD